MAEHERDATFARTKPRLLPPRTKGKKLGNYRRIEAKQRAATARAEAVRPAVTETRHLSTRAPAHELEPSRHHDDERQAMTRCRSIAPADASAYDRLGVLRSGAALALVGRRTPPHTICKALNPKPRSTAATGASTKTSGSFFNRN
jgi:hypothetical protein